MDISQIKSQIPAENTHAREDKALKKACKDFEGILLNFMLKSMRKTLSGDSVFGQSHGKNIYQSMYDEHLAQEISSGENNAGIGDVLYRQLNKGESIQPKEQEQLKPNASDHHLNSIPNIIPDIRSTIK